MWRMISKATDCNLPIFTFRSSRMRTALGRNFFDASILSAKTFREATISCEQRGSDQTKRTDIWKNRRLLNYRCFQAINLSAAIKFVLINFELAIRFLNYRQLQSKGRFAVELSMQTDNRPGDLFAFDQLILIDYQHQLLIGFKPK